VKGPRPLGLKPVKMPDGFPGRVTFIKSASKLSEAPHVPLPEICFCGRSNVGKSSLINSLCNRRQLARVSSTPGRTRLLNFFNVQDAVCFADLPGYGWANVPTKMRATWGKTIQGYLESRPQLGLAMLLVDVRREPGEEERNLLSWFQAQGLRCLIVGTKADKLANSKRDPRRRALAKALGVKPADVVAFSSVTGLGRETLWSTILSHAESFERRGDMEPGMAVSQEGDSDE
jgi:GTP-binding protein